MWPHLPSLISHHSSGYTWERPSPVHHQTIHTQCTPVCAICMILCVRRLHMGQPRLVPPCLHAPIFTPVTLIVSRLHLGQALLVPLSPAPPPPGDWGLHRPGQAGARDTHVFIIGARDTHVFYLLYMRLGTAPTWPSRCQRHTCVFVLMYCETRCGEECTYM